MAIGSTAGQVSSGLKGETEDLNQRQESVKTLLGRDVAEIKKDPKSLFVAIGDFEKSINTVVEAIKKASPRDKASVGLLRGAEDSLDRAAKTLETVEKKVKIIDKSSFWLWRKLQQLGAIIFGKLSCEVDSPVNISRKNPFKEVHELCAAKIGKEFSGYSPLDIERTKRVLETVVPEPALAQWLQTKEQPSQEGAKPSEKAPGLAATASTTVMENKEYVSSIQASQPVPAESPQTGNLDQVVKTFVKEIGIDLIERGGGLRGSGELKLTDYARCYITHSKGEAGTSKYILTVKTNEGGKEKQKELLLSLSGGQLLASDSQMGINLGEITKEKLETLKSLLELREATKLVLSFTDFQGIAGAETVLQRLLDAVPSRLSAVDFTDACKLLGNSAKGAFTIVRREGTWVFLCWDGGKVVEKPIKWSSAGFEIEGQSTTEPNKLVEALVEATVRGISPHYPEQIRNWIKGSGILATSFGNMYQASVDEKRAKDIGKVCSATAWCITPNTITEAPGWFGKTCGGIAQAGAFAGRVWKSVINKVVGPTTEVPLEMKDWDYCVRIFGQKTVVHKLTPVVVQDGSVKIAVEGCPETYDSLEKVERALGLKEENTFTALDAKAKKLAEEEAAKARELAKEVAKRDQMNRAVREMLNSPKQGLSGKMYIFRPPPTSYTDQPSVEGGKEQFQGIAKELRKGESIGYLYEYQGKFYWVRLSSDEKTKIPDRILETGVLAEVPSFRVDGKTYSPRGLKDAFALFLEEEGWGNTLYSIEEAKEVIKKRKEEALSEAAKASVVERSAQPQTPSRTPTPLPVTPSHTPPHTPPPQQEIKAVPHPLPPHLPPSPVTSVQQPTTVTTIPDRPGWLSSTDPWPKMGKGERLDTHIKPLIEKLRIVKSLEAAGDVKDLGSVDRRIHAWIRALMGGLTRKDVDMSLMEGITKTLPAIEKFWLLELCTNAKVVTRNKEETARLVKDSLMTELPLADRTFLDNYVKKNIGSYDGATSLDGAIAYLGGVIGLR